MINFGDGQGGGGQGWGAGGAFPPPWVKLSKLQNIDKINLFWMGGWATTGREGGINLYSNSNITIPITIPINIPITINFSGGQLWRWSRGGCGGGLPPALPGWVGGPNFKKINVFYPPQAGRGGSTYIVIVILLFLLLSLFLSLELTRER